MPQNGGLRRMPMAHWALAALALTCLANLPARVTGRRPARSGMVTRTPCILLDRRWARRLC